MNAPQECTSLILSRNIKEILKIFFIGPWFEASQYMEINYALIKLFFKCLMAIFVKIHSTVAFALVRARTLFSYFLMFNR